MVGSEHNEEFAVPKGTVIFNRGDRGEAMYLVAAGRVRLLIGEGDHRTEVARLGPGEFFGELSLLSGAPRNATAEAVEDSRLLAIGRSAFGLMMQDDLDVVFRMMNTQGERLRQADLPLEALTQRMGRLRIGMNALGRAVGAVAAGPVAVAIADVAHDLSLSVESVRSVLAGFAQSGAGRIEAQAWHVASAAELEKFVAALGGETEV